MENNDERSFPQIIQEMKQQQKNHMNNLNQFYIKQEPNIYQRNLQNKTQNEIMKLP
jgi:hypothetical protein